MVRNPNLPGRMVKSIIDNLEGVVGSISRICMTAAAVGLGFIVILNCARIFIEKMGILSYQ